MNKPQPIKVQPWKQAMTMAMESAKNQLRGLEPMPLEHDLLVQRVKMGGYSGEFLADAFFSTYRNKPFHFNLYGIIKLDGEAFRLFHQILHMRLVPGWDDEALYKTECEIKAIIK